MSVYAIPADVTARWDGSAETSRIQAQLDDAHVLLDARVRAATGMSLDEWVASGKTSAAMVKIVLVRSVARGLDNPRGFLSEHAGEYGYSLGQTTAAVNAAAAASRGGFTDDDLADLGIVTTPIGSFRLAPPRYATCSPFVSESTTRYGHSW